MEKLNVSTSTPPLAKSDEQVRRDIDKISLEFLLNKKMYKKIIGTMSLQTERENEERQQYMVTYRTEIMRLFEQMLNDRERVKVGQEIHELFDSFIDKAVSYFIRTQKMLNPRTQFGDDDDDDDDDDEAVDETDTNNKKNTNAFNKHIYGGSSINFQKKKQSNFGDDIELNL